MGYSTTKKVDGEEVIIPSTNQRDWDRLNNRLMILEKLGLIKYKPRFVPYKDTIIERIYYELT